MATVKNPPPSPIVCLLLFRVPYHVPYGMNSGSCALIHLLSAVLIRAQEQGRPHRHLRNLRTYTLTFEVKR